MEHQINQDNYNEEPDHKKIKQFEKEVALGLWIQVLGQVIEIKGLTGLLNIERDTDLVGETQILTGVWIKTIGQLLEAISVSCQIGEKDLIKLLQEQKVAITGDFLVSLGAAYEVLGGIRTLGEEETAQTLQIIP
ncbi:hypothetical protein ACE38V_10255 [Cytobacillus sp. Hz8]|uniref:hypothetical protein n=1 Tax=Cytobacillus sp. Hz8 TaxID=3347168 RepID=UPI0035DE6C7B